MIREAIAKILERENLSGSESREVLDEIMSGACTPAQTAAFLTALRAKGETIEEIAGAAESLRASASHVYLKASKLLDTCGTGGDAKGTFNISTLAAFVCAGAGAFIAKHGNRSVSSRCGSADLLRELGARVELEIPQIEACFKKTGIAFLFAPLLNPAMRQVQLIRREIGVRTIFNLLGPLTNPARAGHQLLGVYREDLTEVVAAVLKRLGSRHALVVHGQDGLDEVTTTGTTKICELKAGRIKSFRIKPSDFGIPRAKLADLQGGDARENARIGMDVLEGRHGPARDVVAFNAACALYAADSADSIAKGLKLSETSIDEGHALNKLKMFIDQSNRVAAPRV